MNEIYSKIKLYYNENEVGGIEKMRQIEARLGARDIFPGMYSTLKRRDLYKNKTLKSVEVLMYKDSKKDDIELVPGVLTDNILLMAENAIKDIPYTKTSFERWKTNINDRRR